MFDGTFSSILLSYLIMIRNVIMRPISLNNFTNYLQNRLVREGLNDVLDKNNND